MAEENKNVAADLDLDEDLFNFDEVMPEESGDVEGEIDLDEIFAAFQEGDDEAEEEERAADAETEEEDPFADFEPPAPSENADEAPEPVAEPVAEEAAPAPTASAPVDDDEFEDDDSAFDQLYDDEPVEPAPRKQKRGRRRAPAQSGRSVAVTFLTKGAAVVLIAMTLLNISIALVTFSSANGMKDDLAAASQEMAEAALSIRDNVTEQTEQVRDTFTPVVAPTLDEHPTFDRAIADIEVGNFADGRQRIYALLAVVDRQPPDIRDELEARAAYLLAQSYHAEAAKRAGGDE